MRAAGFATTFALLVAPSADAADAPSKLAAAKVAQIAARFVAAERIDVAGFRAGTPSFHADDRLWIVLYQAPSSTTPGDGHFGVLVDDDDPTDVSLEQGL